MDEELVMQKIRFACDKHELRGETQEAIMAWAQHAMLNYGLLKNIEAGMIEVSGVNSAGDVLFQMTEDGKQQANRIFNKT